jgi:two-component system response regulator YesN
LITIMIVDDEYHIREGIKKTVPWADLGLEMVSEADNGLKAWLQFEENSPDIILLDINIPELNGIALAQRIREHGAPTQIIFLTGYDDFRLVKEAVVLGASDYLLKPVGYDELFRSLIKAIQSVEQQRKQVHYIDALTKKADSYGKAAIDRLFLEMLQQVKPLQDCLEQLRSLDIVLNEQAKYVMINAEVVHYDNIMSQVSSRDRGLYIYAYRKLAQEVLEEYKNGRVLLEKPNQVLIIWELTNEQENHYGRYSKRFQEIVSLYLKMKVSVGISNIVHGVKQLPLAYYQSGIALKYISLLGEGKIIPYNIVEPSSAIGNKMVGKEISLLTELRLGNGNQVMPILEQWFAELNGLPWEEVKLIASQVIVFVLRISTEVDLNNQELTAIQPLEELGHLANMESLKTFLSAYLMKVTLAIQKNKELPALKIIDQAKKWIRDNMNDEVSLTKLADHLYLNANYLSQLFKKSTGETFIDFVTRERMEKAKELLQNPHMKIFEIANLVGFKDSNYFSIAFKNKLGFTPSEYRQRLV